MGGVRSSNRWGPDGQAPHNGGGGTGSHPVHELGLSPLLSRIALAQALRW